MSAPLSAPWWMDDFSPRPIHPGQGPDPLWLFPFPLFLRACPASLSTAFHVLSSAASRGAQELLGPVLSRGAGLLLPPAPGQQARGEGGAGLCGSPEPLWPPQRPVTTAV